MKNTALALLLALIAATAGADPAEVRFGAPDGITIYGDVYASAAGKSAPIILLFHQAGSDARGEYGTIAPRLVEAGYNVLAVDQRSGGSRLGGSNRTVAALDAAEYGYCDVYPDLEATLAYARESGFDGPLAVWGSSYSAALVFQLAARNSADVNAVLGFSPASGEPLADCRPESYLDRLEAPAIALRPKQEAAIDSVRAQLALFGKHGIRTYIADPGAHGSAMLDEARVGASTQATWGVVLDFLEQNLN